MGPCFLIASGALMAIRWVFTKTYFFRQDQVGFLSTRSSNIDQLDRLIPSIAYPGTCIACFFYFRHVMSLQSMKRLARMPPGGLQVHNECLGDIQRVYVVSCGHFSKTRELMVMGAPLV